MHCDLIVKIGYKGSSSEHSFIVLDQNGRQVWTEVLLDET